jgi:hypothetical protein
MTNDQIRKTWFPFKLCPAEMVNKKNESHDWHRRAEIKIITHIQIYFDLFPEL